MNNSAKVGKAIGTALLVTLVFSAIYLLIAFVAGFIFNALYGVPLLGPILRRLRVVPELAGAYWGASVALGASESIAKHAPTSGLACILSGTLLILIHGVCAALNLSYGNPVFANVVQLLAGILLIYFGNKTYKG